VGKKAKPYRTITCEVCGNMGRINLKIRDVCRPCYLSEPESYCDGCKSIRPHVRPRDKQCARCIKRAGQTDQCVQCGNVGVLVKSLCKPCCKAKYQQTRNQKKLIKAVCSDCGKLRRPALIGVPICKACYPKRLNGIGICTKCGKERTIENQGKRLCKQCYTESLASKLLRKYLDEFTSPYPYNRFLFELLTPSIDWSSVKEFHYQTFKAIGRFLQSTKIPKPLTWEKIDELLPPLGKSSGRMMAKRIRQSLFDMGHALAKKKLLESRDSYIARRNALSLIGVASVHLQPILKRYADWMLQTRKSKLRTVREHLTVLVKFWSYSCEQRIYSPEEVSPVLITAYVQNLYRQWQCSTCKKLNFAQSKVVEERECTKCGASNSAPKIKRYAQTTVYNHRAVLKVFFSWAKLNRVTVTMPVTVTTQRPAPSITHYPIQTVERLYSYIWDPAVEPAGALILYMVLAHACSSWELRYSQIPQVTSINPSSCSVPLSELYRLMLPERQPSFGNRSPGRPEPVIKFHPEVSSRLKPLLDRYERQRERTLINPSNPYLMVSKYTSRLVHPVGTYFLWKLVQITTKEAVGYSCNINTLRKTFAVILADQGGGGVLLKLGWHHLQATHYTFSNRVVLSPV
jgi:hypothetical protein